MKYQKSSQRKNRMSDYLFICEDSIKFNDLTIIKIMEFIEILKQRKLAMQATSSAKNII